MIHHHHHDIKIWKNILGRVNNWTYLTSELWTHTAYVTEVKIIDYATRCFDEFVFSPSMLNVTGDPRFSAEYEHNSKYDGHLARNSSKTIRK